VGYIGPEYKRPEVKGADYINLKPGEDLVRTVVISDFYDFSATGTYNLSYKVTSNQLYSEKGSGTLNNADSLVSNEIELKVAGRPAKDLPVSPDAVTGTTSYNKCTTTQQTSLVSARNQASLYSGGALSYLNANTQGPRYTTWFGVYDSARYSTVKTHFTAISSAMDTKPVTFDCGCKKNYYAYVYPTKPYVIYLCKVFWTAPLSGTDSKAGTLIHEMSHFNVVASTDDYVYGQTLAKNLAITDPTKAINNADNHEYFAENTPAQQ
jgi:peptidyl-Lys metalloendopeptidase